MKKFKNDWIIYMLVGILALALGVVLIPGVTDLGEKTLSLVIALALVIYLFTFLLKKIITKSSNVIKVLTIIEFIVILLIALGLVLSQFKVINISGACKIIGCVLWLRGSVEMIHAYFFKGEKKNYPLWLVFVNLGFVTLGTYMFAKPFITDETFILIMAIIFLLIGLISLIFMVKRLPNKNKSK